MEITARHSRKNYSFLMKSKARTNILFGGAGSAKSWSIGQYLLLEKLYREKNIRVLVIRKTGPALKKSSWLLICDLLKRYNLPHTKNLTDLVIRTINGNECYFTSIDDPEKLKSFERINYIWSEESTELSRNDYMQLHLRCRGENEDGVNQLYFSFNPIDEMSFLKIITDDPPDRTAVCHSTYLDNEFLDAENIKDIERLIDQDKTYDMIYRQGLWATPENIIYKNWDIQPMAEKYNDIYWGLDFGYSSDECALVEIRIRGDETWERERIYETGLTNPQLITKMQEIITNRDQIIVADSAEPKSIQEIQNAGFNIHPCKKGKDSVRFGINAVKSVYTHIDPESVHLQKEKRSYKWKEDKNGNVLTEPVKFHDHLMDAERYVLMRIKGKVRAGFVFDSVEDQTEDRSGQNRYGAVA